MENIFKKINNYIEKTMNDEFKDMRIFLCGIATGCCISAIVLTFLAYFRGIYT